MTATLETRNSVIRTTIGTTIPNVMTSRWLTSSFSPTTGRPLVCLRRHPTSSIKHAPRNTTEATASIHHHSTSMSWDCGLLECSAFWPLSAHPATSPAPHTDAAAHNRRRAVGLVPKRRPRRTPARMGENDGSGVGRRHEARDRLVGCVGWALARLGRQPPPRRARRRRRRRHGGHGRRARRVGPDGGRIPDACGRAAGPAAGGLADRGRQLAAARRAVADGRAGPPRARALDQRADGRRRHARGAGPSRLHGAPRLGHTEPRGGRRRRRTHRRPPADRQRRTARPPRALNAWYLAAAILPAG